jgi:hypothetical protein
MDTIYMLQAGGVSKVYIFCDNVSTFNITSFICSCWTCKHAKKFENSKFENPPKILICIAKMHSLYYTTFVSSLLKEYHARASKDVARLSESVKILEPRASVFLRFPKVE